MLLTLLFVVVALAIALIRLRTSPVYPPLNPINSDIYAYQVVGNSWVAGRWPYRDVYDVKGPAFYLLFGLFARLRAWSMAPPLAFLTVLATASLWLSYAIARLRLRSRRLAVVSAVGCCLVVYLGVAGVVSSFTCEELAVPGVLLLLWLVSRWLGPDQAPVRARWWVLGGAVLGLLFWAKYQVVAPWAAVLIALLVTIAVTRSSSGRAGSRRLEPGLGRVVGWQLVGFVVTTMAVLACYAPVLRDMLGAYFWAKRGNVVFSRELPAEGRFLLSVVTGNPAAALVLLGIAIFAVLQAVRGSGRYRWVLPIAFVLSMWAATAFVRHPNNLFVPLTFLAVVLPALAAPLEARGRLAGRFAGAGLILLSLGVLAQPIVQSVTGAGLGRRTDAVTCYALPDHRRVGAYPGVATAFARTSGRQPILSLGNLSGAQSMYASHLVMERPYEFVDASWAITTGADVVQTRYLQQRTFDWVWIRVPGLRRFDDLAPQIVAARYTNGPSQPEQASALVSEYLPVLTCNNEILLRAR